MADGFDIALGAVAALVAAKVVSKVAGPVVKGVGAVVGAGIVHAVSESERQRAFDAGLGSALPPRETGKAGWDAELQRSYDAGQRERDRQFEAASRIAGVHISHNRHVIGYSDD